MSSLAGRTDDAASEIRTPAYPRDRRQGPAVTPHAACGILRSPSSRSREEASMPRVAPVTGKSDVPAEHHHVVDAVVEVFGNVRGPFSVLLHSPLLAEHVLGLVKFFRDESVVEGP